MTMKGFKIGLHLALAVLLGLIVLAFGVKFFLEEKIESATAPTQKEPVECLVNADCTCPKGELCISVNREPYHCGCLDDSDCCGGKLCKNNRCV